MDLESHNATTITILDVTLSLVHIPRSRLVELNRPILKQLLRKNPKFLNLTANEIELSIFAEEDELSDFEPIARKDRQKQRLLDRADSASSSASRRRKRSTRLLDVPEPVEISFERWKVLQIDSHDDSHSDSGNRVRELSAPLAAAGISILYQSSYLSDFIFVKASRLPEVLNLLGDSGFTLYNANPYQELSSNLPQSVRERFGDGDKQFAHLQDEMNSFSLSQPGSPGAMSPAVLSRTRSPSVASIAVLSKVISKSGTIEGCSSYTSMTHDPKTDDSPISSSVTSRASRTPKKSMSPTAAPVEVLAPDLACVGLNESAADFWTLKILTLVGYPELIPLPGMQAQTWHDMRRNSLTDSLYGSHSDVAPHDRCSSPIAGPLSPSAVFSHDEEDLEAGGKRLEEEPKFLRLSSSPKPFCHDSLSSCSSSDDEEYFSSSSPYNRTRIDLDSTPSLASTTSQSSARSLPEHLDELQKIERPHLNKISTTAGPLPSNVPSAELRDAFRASRSTRNKALRVPFFSFTRTAEGSSLTTDICVLSSLFGLDDRHMVICSGTLLEVGDDLNACGAAEQQFGVGDKQRVFNLEGSDSLDEDEPAPGTMKCLQIDLQKFGLDKYGLVNRFSRVLEENGINHMYSSTYKTANLLVDKINAGRAKALLRSC
ncbi:uncharacterized protein FOMMEDRAFT_21720 [Fomitiporia mediterranea MF3/22]|uniref:uncharacterized protein n=1 Tax=Fomitiporia mediterranea (strain MF3/22) TaxID=694068 RepID=UPI00044085D5|nr:uncharacterized protein FOMMEDRAFT_21720 [Fomitiporia mediterranea MF3/22]EJD01303.1 hypothetical protein FOMMEDRAFT_21720 [Fomitiporia mediterranea MF3/22]